MKIKNLQIGSIYQVNSIEDYGPREMGCYYFAHTKELEKSIFLKCNASSIVMDLRSGKKYPTSIRTEEKINFYFVKNLDSETVPKMLKDAGYQKEEISKRKLFKILKKKGWIQFES